MKKLFNILFIITLSIGYVSCSDDDDNTSSMTIVKADTIFEADGGSGTIEVSGTGTITASPDVDWCTASVSNNIVNISLEENSDLTGRVALITIKSGTESLIIRITQSGYLFWIKGLEETLAFEIAGETKAYKYKSTYPISVVDKPEWLDIEITEDFIYFTASAANLAQVGNLILKTGEKEKIYKAIQISYESFLGNWIMNYKNRVGANVSFDVTLTEKEKGTSYTLSGVPFPFTVEYTPNKGSLDIHPQYLSEHSLGPVYLYPCTSTNGFYSSLQFGSLLGNTGKENDNIVIKYTPDGIQAAAVGLIVMITGTNNYYWNDDTSYFDVVMTKK